MSKNKSYPVDDEDERWGASQVGCQWGDDSIITETKPMRTQLELHLINQGVLGNGASAKSAKMKKMLKERRKRLQESGKVGGKLGLLDAIAAMGVSEEDEDMAASQSRRRSRAARRNTSLTSLGGFDANGGESGQIGILLGGDNDAMPEKPKMTTYLWVAARKKLFPGGQGLRVPKDAYKDSTWFWRLIKSYVTVDDCISSYVPDFSVLRNARHYTAIKMEGGEKPVHPEPFLASPNPIYWLASLKDYQDRLREYSRIEWRPKQEVPAHIKRHRKYVAQHSKTRALLLGVSVDAVEGSPLARIGAPGKASNKETKAIQRELNEVTTYLDERDRVSVEDREFIHGNDKMRRRLRYGLRVQEGLFTPSRLPHFYKYGGTPTEPSTRCNSATAGQPGVLSAHIGARSATPIHNSIFISSGPVSAPPKRHHSAVELAVEGHQGWSSSSSDESEKHKGTECVVGGGMANSARLTTDTSRPMILSPIRGGGVPLNSSNSIEVSHHNRSLSQQSPQTTNTASAYSSQQLYNPRSAHFGAFNSTSQHLPTYLPGGGGTSVVGGMSPLAAIRAARLETPVSSMKPTYLKPTGTSSPPVKVGTRRLNSPIRVEAGGRDLNSTTADGVVPDPIVMEVADFSFLNLQCIYNVLFKLPRNIPVGPATSSTSSIAPPVSGCRINPLDYLEGGAVYERRKEQIQIQRYGEGGVAPDGNKVDGKQGKEAAHIGLSKVELNTIKAKGETYVFPKDGAATFNSPNTTNRRGEQTRSTGGKGFTSNGQPIITENSLSFLFKSDPQSMRERDVEEELSLNTFARKYFEHPVARVIFRKALKVDLVPLPTGGTVVALDPKPISIDQQRQLAQLKILTFPTGVSLLQKHFIKNAAVSTNQMNDLIHKQPTISGNAKQPGEGMDSGGSSGGGGNSSSAAVVDSSPQQPLIIVAPIETTGNSAVDLRRITGCKILNLSNNGFGNIAKPEVVPQKKTFVSMSNLAKKPNGKKGCHSDNAVSSGNSKDFNIKPTDDEVLLEHCQSERDLGGFYFASAFLCQRISRVDTITSLDLSSNSLEVFPVKFIHYDLPSLTSLAFHNNRVDSFGPIVELAAGILRDPVTPATRAAQMKENPKLAGLASNTQLIPAPNFAILPAVLKGGRMCRFNPYGVLAPVSDSPSSTVAAAGGGGGTASCRVHSLPSDTTNITEALAKELFNPATTPLIGPPLFLHMLLTTPQSSLFPLMLGEREFTIDNSSAARKARMKQLIHQVVGVVVEGKPYDVDQDGTGLGALQPHTRYIRREFQTPLQRRLRSLTLHGNPVQSQHFAVYRQKIMFLFPNIVSLDINPITPAERAAIMW